MSILRRIGHVERMNEEKLTKQVYAGRVEGKCGR